MDPYNTKNTKYAIENVEQRLLDLTQSGYPNGKIKTTWKILNSSDIRYMHIKTYYTRVIIYACYTHIIYFVWTTGKEDIEIMALYTLM